MSIGMVRGMVPQGKGREGIGRDRKGTHSVSPLIETSSSSFSYVMAGAVNG